MSKETDQVLGHNFDGIEEYNNPLPGWWLWLFYLSIAYAIVYVPYYHFMDGGDQHAEYKAEMEAAAAAAPKTEVKTGASLAALLTDKARMEEGKATFIKVCSACHRRTAAVWWAPT